MTMTSQTEDLLTFTADGALYAVAVNRVQEILDLQPLAPLPSAPPHVLGVTNLRGQNVPVVDLRRLLRLPDGENTPQTRFIVVWVDAPAGRFTLGLRTDRVIEVTRLDGDSLGTLEDGGVLGWSAKALAGIGRRNGQVVSLLDLDRLFSGLAEIEPAEAL
jgi:purine-binding chemotaxis protein CheW